MKNQPRSQVNDMSNNYSWVYRRFELISWLDQNYGVYKQFNRSFPESALGIFKNRVPRIVHHYCSIVIIISASLLLHCYCTLDSLGCGVADWLKGWFFPDKWGGSNASLRSAIFGGPPHIQFLRRPSPYNSKSVFRRGCRLYETIEDSLVDIKSLIRSCHPVRRRGLWLYVARDISWRVFGRKQTGERQATHQLWTHTKKRLKKR